MENVIYKLVPWRLGYSAGTDGTVWSCWMRKPIWRDGRCHGTEAVLRNIWTLLTPDKKEHGHCQITLGKGHRYLLHRLILEVFVGPCPKNMWACHNDGNASNNALSNLRWDTPKANYADSVKHDTNCKGETHGCAKLTADQILQIREECYLRHLPKYKIAKKYGVTPSTISMIHKKQTWTHIVDSGKHDATCNGETYGCSKLTVEQVHAIRAACELGSITKRQLAKNYGVSAATISNIHKKQTWTRI